MSCGRRKGAHICERREVPGQCWASLYPDALVHQLLLVEPGPGNRTERERIVVLSSGVLGFRLTGSAQVGLGAEYEGGTSTITVTVAFGTDHGYLSYHIPTHLAPRAGLRPRPLACAALPVYHPHLHAGKGELMSPGLRLYLTLSQ